MSDKNQPSLEAIAFDPFAGPAIVSAAPSTEPQREIWTAARLGTEASLAFNESCSLRLAGALDLAALRAALDDLVARHEALRTTFSPDGLTLCVNAPTSVGASLVDLSGLPETERPAALADVVAGEVEEPFDLERGPLLRVRIARLAPEDHQIVFTAHHIVLDGWSTAVIMKEWGQLYSARRRGAVADLPPAVRFSEYAAVQAEAERAPKYAEAERYWLKQFAGEIPILDLPYDRPRPAVKTFPSQREDIALDADLARDAKRMGAKEGASFFTTLLAAFKVLIHRLSGQEDVVVGIPAAGQSIGGYESLVGHCVNTLPLRSAIAGGRPFREVVRALRTTMLDAYEHQEHTFGSLLKKLPISRDPSRPPIVTVVFNLEQGLFGDAVPFDGLRVRFFSNPRHFENFDLFVNAVEGEGRVVLECQYNTDLFDRATIRDWVARLERLLRAAVANPACPVGKLPIMSDEERRRILVEWNRTNVDHRVEATIHQLFMEQAALRPEAVAVVHEDAVLTYGELDRRSSQLANRLRRLGVGPDVPVGLCLDRSFDVIISLLGILKAGGGYVSLESAYPRERLAFMLEDAAIPVVVTDSRLAASLPLDGGKLVLLDREAESLRGESVEAPSSGATASSLAYITYTSGSTGKPKGVQIVHRAVNRLVRAVDYVDLGPDSVVLHVSTVAFDASTFEIWGALLNGGRLVLYPENVPTAAGLGRIFERYGVTTSFLTTALFNAVVDEDPRLFAPLRQLYLGGESASADHVRRALEALETTRLYNAYGPTECTTFATTHPLHRPLAPTVRTIPIGKPIRDTELYVLDRQMEPVPVGVVGELYLGGPGLARGYLKRPELTAERFVTSPFGSPGEKLYRTGDLVRYLPDGTVDFIGRADNQVKIRGFRIELGEIEAALQAHAAVAQNVVLAREDAPGSKRLVAYVVPATGSAPNEDALAEHLRQSLPKFMIPQAFVFLDAFPLNASGKVDRRKLPAPSVGGAEESYVEPRNETERLVAELWQKALGLPRVSVHDNFFKLGGHSLLAAQVLSRLNREHQIVLPFRTIFEAPTIAQFAEVVDRQRAQGSAAPVARIPKRTGSGPARASLMQERLLLLEDLDPDRRLVNNVPSAFRLQGPLDVGALERSLNEVVRRHEALRTSFRGEAAGAVQIVSPALTFRLEPEELTALQGDAQEEALKARLAEIAREPFDLAKGPLFRARLFRLGPDHHVFFTVRHNAIWDGWSFDIFRHELSTLYAAHTQGTPAQLPELPISYGDFAEWHRAWLEGPEIARQMEFWTRRLAGSPQPIEMPTDRPRPAVRSYGGANEWVDIPRAEADALTALARDHDATLFMVLLAAFDVLLHRYTDQRDLVVASPIRARTRPEIEDIIGLFTNTLMMRTEVDPDATFLGLLRRVRETTLEAFNHQELPFDLLAEKAPPMRVLFSMQEARHRATALGDVTLTLPHVLPPAAAVDINFWVVEMKDRLMGALNYSTALFDRETMVRFLGQYRRILRAVAENPHATVARIPLLEDDERRALLVHASPAAPLDPSATAHGLFEAQALRRPEAIAIIAEGQRTSYAELDRRAVALAAEMKPAGAGARVAIALERPLDRAIALLAALKAGATILALDPADPPARLDALLAAGRVNLLLAEHGLASDLVQRPARVLFPRGAPNDGGFAAAGGLEGLSGAAGATPPVSPDTVAWLECVTRPEGAASVVPLTQRSLAGRLRAAARRLELGDGDVALLAPDSTPFEALLPLVAGATVIALDADTAEDGESLRAAIDAHGATFLCAPAARWWSLLAAEWAGRPELRAVCPDLTQELAGELLPRVGVLHSAYVLEEAGGWCALRRVADPGERLLAGEPLDGLRLAVLDTHLEPPPPGAPGALFVGCEDPSPEALASQRLVADPLSTMPGSRLLRTDDRATYRPDGEIAIVGRSDSQAWIDGRRIDLAEVASALGRHPAIKEAAVRPAALPRQGPQLAAYVVARPGQSYTDSDLRRHLRGAIPRRAIPRHFVEMDSLPRLADGRVAPEYLPSPFAKREAGDEHVSPRNDTEKLLASFWEQALGVSGVSIQDNFFSLGGHSLLCLQVVARIERETGKKLKPRTLLLSTLEQAAAELERAPSRDRAAGTAA